MQKPVNMGYRSRIVYNAILRLTEEKGDMPSFGECKREIVDKEEMALKTFQNNRKWLLNKGYITENNDPKHKQKILFGISEDSKTLEKLRVDCKDYIRNMKQQLDSIPLDVKKDRQSAKSHIEENKLLFLRKYSLESKSPTNRIGSFENMLSLVCGECLHIVEKIKANAVRDEAYAIFSKCIESMMKLLAFRTSSIKRGIIKNDLQKERRFVRKLIRTLG